MHSILSKRLRDACRWWCVVTEPLPLPRSDQGDAARDHADTKNEQKRIALHLACFTPAGLPGASGAVESVAAKALETIRLDARMAAPIVRI